MPGLNRNIKENVKRKTLSGIGIEVLYLFHKVLENENPKYLSA